MDSMRSLNRSLEPADNLNSDFRAAAISVTTLYKKALKHEQQARQAGYQDALDDLLSFLDREHLGLQDGEGWLVRQWATKLLDDRPLTTTNNGKESAEPDSEDEKEVEKEKSPSPAPAQESSPIHPSSDRQIVDQRTTQLIHPPSPNQSVISLRSIIPPRAEAFTFQSPHAYPKDVEMQVDTAQKREVSPRATRSRKPVKKTFSAKVLGAGSGHKRKAPFSEFFDIADLTTDKEEGRKPAVRRKMA